MANSETHQRMKPTYIKIVGISFTKSKAKLKVGDEVVLVPEPDNKYDPLALRVDTLDGEKLGYIGKDCTQRGYLLSKAPLKAALTRANYWSEEDEEKSEPLWEGIEVGMVSQLLLVIDCPAPETSGATTIKTFTGETILYNPHGDPRYTTLDGTPLMGSTAYMESQLGTVDLTPMAIAIAKKAGKDPEGKPKVSKEDVTNMWNLRGDVARYFGSMVHAGLEMVHKYHFQSGLIDEVYKKDGKPAKSYTKFLNPAVQEPIEKFIEQFGLNAMAEVFISSVEHALCTQVDRLVIKDMKGKACRIGDYKTNEKFDKRKAEEYAHQFSFSRAILEHHGWKVDDTADVYWWNTQEQKWELIEVPLHKIELSKGEGDE